MKSYEVGRLVQTYANINLSLKSSHCKLKQRIVKMKMKTEMQTKHYEQRSVRKMLTKYPISLNKHLV